MRTFKGEKAFTLLEAIASLAILSIGLIAVVKSFSSSVQAGSYTQGLTIATFLSEGKIAELETTSQTTLGTETGDFGEDYPNYRWETEVSSTENEKIQEAVVSIFWRKRGEERKIELITLLPQRSIAEGIE